MQDAQSVGFFYVENPAAPAVQCLVWAVLSLLYIYNKSSAAVSEGNKHRQAAASLYDPTRENGIPERPQTLRHSENIDNSSAEDG